MDPFKETDVVFTTGVTKAGISTKIPDVVELIDSSASEKILSLKSILFSKKSLEKLLSASGCEGIRFFPILYDVENNGGVDTTNRLTLMAIGVNNDADKATGDVVYISQRPCPPHCPKLDESNDVKVNVKLEVKKSSS